MDQERHRFVQQYIERQRTYIPTYTAVDPLLDPNGTPLDFKLGRDDEYGFDTPVLRPRAPVKSPKAQLALQAGSSKSRLQTHDADLPNEAAPTPHEDGKTGLTKKGKPRTKRRKEPTPIVDTDDERAARLADRRERKRKKRAIVDPPQMHDNDVEPTAAPKKGRTNGQKAKKPAALALLYGFSATNVTKNRLTVKPAPSLGVFNKGKASAKKVTAMKRASSRNELFSESAFLNKPNSNERAVDASKLNDNSDDSCVSSVSSIRQEHAKKNRIKCAGTAATKVLQASTRTTAESEVWDIELHSKLPSSVCDVSSEPRVESSAPVILDLRRAEWSASLDMAEKHAERLGKTPTPSVAVTRCRSEEHSVIRSSPLAIWNLRDELGLALAADVSSIHPSHSASQVGARAADGGPSDLRVATCKYFIEPTPVPVQEFPAKPSQTSKSTVDIETPDSQIAEQDVREAAMDVETNRRVASPINSLISAPQTMIHYQARYDMVPLEFSSDSSAYGGFVDAHWDPLGRPDRGYVELYRNVEPSHDSPQGGAWDWSPSAGLAIDDVDMEATCDDPLASESAEHLDEPEALVDACYFDTQAESDREEEQDRWYCAGERRPIYEDETGYEVSLDGEEDVPDFLEGRALLLGLPEERGYVGMSGLAQAEMDVASRLRDHWRPLRF